MVSYEEKKEWLVKEIGFAPVDDEVAVDFYYKGMHDFGLGLYDTDDYAWLNTLLGYDIGGDRARAIIDWYYVNEDTTVQEAVGVLQDEELKMVCEWLGFHIDFSHWRTTEPDCLECGFKEYFEEKGE